MLFEVQTSLCQMCVPSLNSAVIGVLTYATKLVTVGVRVCIPSCTSDLAIWLFPNLLFGYYLTSPPPPPPKLHPPKTQYIVVCCCCKKQSATLHRHFVTHNLCLSTLCKIKNIHMSSQVTLILTSEGPVWQVHPSHGLFSLQNTAVAVIVLLDINSRLYLRFVFTLLVPCNALFSTRLYECFQILTSKPEFCQQGK